MMPHSASVRRRGIYKVEEFAGRKILFQILFKRELNTDQQRCDFLHRERELGLTLMLNEFQCFSGGLPVPTETFHK